MVQSSAVQLNAVRPNAVQLDEASSNQTLRDVGSARRSDKPESQAAENESNLLRLLLLSCVPSCSRLYLVAFALFLSRKNRIDPQHNVPWHTTPHHKREPGTVLQAHLVYPYNTSIPVPGMVGVVYRTAGYQVRYTVPHYVRYGINTTTAHGVPTAKEQGTPNHNSMWDTVLKGMVVYRTTQSTDGLRRVFPFQFRLPQVDPSLCFCGFLKLTHRFLQGF